MSQTLLPFAENLWFREYPIRYSGCTFSARMTVIRLDDGRLLIHSPGPVDAATKAAIDALGSTAYIVAPGNFHHLHVPSCQRAFPAAETHICPGVERKRPGLRYDGIVDDSPRPGWAADLDQVVVRGSRIMWEVAFCHRASRVLLLVDLIENIGDATPGTNWVLRAFWKYLFRMWNVPKPAPEYQVGWRDKRAAAESLSHILDWDFDRVLIAHGEPIESDAKETLRTAWGSVLRHLDRH